MSTTSVSGQDTTIINNQVIVGLADQNCTELTFDNDIATAKTGKNGNSIFGFNTMGQQATLKMRVIRGCADDNFLNNLLSQQQANFSGTPLLFGEFIKKLGDGQGNITNDTYILSAGVFQKQVGGKTNTEGDTEQSISEYMMKFAKVFRVLT